MANTHDSIAAVTESDTVDLPKAGILYVSVAGNIKVIGAQQVAADAVTLLNVPVGWHPDFRVRRVYATGTTATGLFVAY